MDNKGKNSHLYLPSLLSRLKDVKNEDVLSDFETLKQEILENIAMILNSRVRPERSDLGNDPFLYRSVLGFGLSDFCGISHSKYTVDNILNEIRELVVFFEPRLDGSSVRVQRIKSQESSSNIEIQISGRVSVAPYNNDVDFLFTLDLESGEPKVKKE